MALILGLLMKPSVFPRARNFPARCLYPQCITRVTSLTLISGQVTLHSHHNVLRRLVRAITMVRGWGMMDRGAALMARWAVLTLSPRMFPATQE